eukprot:TRINITY_DN6424_c2_g1_i1.p1 TRINITY_DN6424_c2_g1~~TRINITY_DN6424_c2_g1_i1.p1  ORF type:complete len:385 (+),score=64.19 TRINITY_DN6424_c2_g1_i1:92-1246(+)
MSFIKSYGLYFIILVFLVVGNNCSSDCFDYDGNKDVKNVCTFISWIDLHIIEDQDSLFEAEVELHYTWEDQAVTNNTKIEDLAWEPTIYLRNRIKERDTYPPIHIFENNRVTRIDRQRSTFAFDMKFRKFPFDKQKVRIYLEPAFDRDFVVVLSSSQDDGDLLEFEDDFTIDGWIHFHDAFIDSFIEDRIYVNNEDIIGLEFGFKTDRAVTSYITQNIIPAIIFVHISFAGFWIDFVSILPRLMPILFTTVSISTFSAELSNFSTRSNEVSFLGSFATMSLFLIAFVLLELLIVHSLNRHNLRNFAKLIDYLSRFFFPGIYWILTIFLFMIIAKDIEWYYCALFLVLSLIVLIIFIGLYIFWRMVYVINKVRKNKKKPDDEEDD